VSLEDEEDEREQKQGDIEALRQEGGIKEGEEVSKKERGSTRLGY